MKDERQVKEDRKEAGGEEKKSRENEEKRGEHVRREELTGQVSRKDER